MRKIVSEEERLIKEKKRAKYFGIFLLFIMVASTAGYAFLYTPSENTGSNLEIKDGEVYQNQQGQWTLRLYGEELIFSYSPQEVNETLIDLNITLSDYASSSLYVDSKDDLVYYEISSNLGKYAPKIQKACYGKCSDENLPEKTCDSNLIIFKESENSKVYQEGKCVFIDGDLKSVDAFIYRMLGL